MIIRFDGKTVVAVLILAEKRYAWLRPRARMILNALVSNATALRDRLLA